MDKQWKKDIKECSYGSPADFLWFYILGGCGCGNSDELKEKTWKVFEHFNQEIMGRDFNFIYENETNELIANWLDSKNLIEHGSSIGGSWLTEDGKELFEQLKKKPQSDDYETEPII